MRTVEGTIALMEATLYELKKYYDRSYIYQDSNEQEMKR